MSVPSRDLLQTHHLMLILRQAMLDPALSGGCFLLAELFKAIANEEKAQSLLDATPAWKMPGLLLSAALLYRAATTTDYPLSRYLPDSGGLPDESFGQAVRQSIVDDHENLSALMAAHTYQCNPPRRMAVSLIALAVFTKSWPAALHIDLGTASGIGLLLRQVRVIPDRGPNLGSKFADLNFPLELGGDPLDLGSLSYPKIERSIGIDLDPPDLHNPDCLAWMRACQFPIKKELEYFDQAISLVKARPPRIERGSVLDVLPVLVKEMPDGQPLIVTDTYMAVFMSEEDREQLRCELDIIAQSRPVIWISNNPLVPAGNSPDSTTAGSKIPPELIERNRNELFGVVNVTTWPEGKRTPQIVGINHPGAGWLEWRPGWV